MYWSIVMTPLPHSFPTCNYSAILYGLYFFLFVVVVVVVFKVNSEGVSWQKLGYSYTVLLTKCANHLGLLLPSNTSASSHHHKDEVRSLQGY